MVRTEEPPDIDGVLDDPVWRDAAVIAPLTQIEPVEGVPPTEPTEVRLLYDDDYLYLAIRAFDSEPGRIIARDMERDSKFQSDDHIALIFDTFHDRRNAYLFRFNPLGAQSDGLVENSREVGENEWDGIWYVEARVDEQGWAAEMALPFKTVVFDPRGTSWGFNIERAIRRKNETARWAAADRDREIISVGEAGVLDGLVGVRKGIGLDIKPASTARFRQDTEGERDFEMEPSVDVFYRITPALTGVLTLNTDFAETEVDERQINLERFELFFPEKRDFFLQDAGIFEFGNLERNGRPFHSRRIGLNEDEEVVDILGGLKLTGRVGPVSLGVLDVVTDDKDELDQKNLFVGRALLNVLDQSSIGLIATHGNPVENEDNAVVGSDFNFRTDEFLGNKPLLANAWVQRSFSENVSGKEWAYGGGVEYPSDRLALELAMAEIQENFRPQLGFVNRRAIRTYSAGARYRHRMPPRQLIRKIDTGVMGEVVTDLDNRVETTETKVDLIKLENDPGDNVSLGYRVGYEDLDEEFEIIDGVVIPQDSYTFHRAAVGFETSNIRPVSIAMEVDAGQFFDGHRIESKPKVEWRPSPHFFLSAEYERNDVFLPEGDFSTNLIRGRVLLQFNPRLTWSNLIQYDDVSKSVGINSRVRWIIDPGNELFLVLNRSFIDEDDDEENGRVRGRGVGGVDPTTETEIAAKLVWTFRF